MFDKESMLKPSSLRSPNANSSVWIKTRKLWNKTSLEFTTSCAVFGGKDITEVMNSNRYCVFRTFFCNVPRENIVKGTFLLFAFGERKLL